MRPPAAVALFAVLSLHAAPLAAGHGMMNAFADIEWLPPAGRTPDQFAYRLDGLAERARLALASNEERYALALGFAREKLAETDAMVRAGKRSAAAVAVAAYGDYLETIAASLATLPPAKARPHAEDFAQALLEHQYIMAVDYLDLPGASRDVIGGVIAAASTHYERVVASLPRAFKAAQFFKEEEIRWSWEVATQADLQGL